MGHADGVQGGDTRRGQVVQRGVDVPAVESGDALGFVLCGHARLVERGVGRMFEFGFGEAFVVKDGAVADQLDLWDAGNGLEVGVEDGFGCVLCFVVAVPVGL